MRPIARVPSLGELPAAALEALPAPRTPLDVADVPHHVGLPGARMQHALLCMATVDVGMSMLMTVSLQLVKDAMEQQLLHAPQPWKENARLWLHVEGVPPTHTVGMADMRKLVVLEGGEYWACVRVDTGGLEWVVVTTGRLKRQQSRGPAWYRVLRECLRSLGPVCRTYTCTAGDVRQAPAVFVEVTRPPRVQGPDVWPVVPNNMWQAEHAAAMCRALRGQATALPRPPVVQSSCNPPAASLGLLHVGQGRGAGSLWRWSPTPRHCACAIVGRARRSRSARAICPPAPWCPEWLQMHGAVPPGDRARLGRGTCPQAERRRCPPSGYGGEHWAAAPRVLRVLVVGRGRPGEVRRCLAPLGGGAVSRGGDAAPAAAAQCPPGSASSPPGPLWRSQFRRQRPSRLPRKASPTSMATIPTSGTCCGTSEASCPRSSVGRRRSTCAPGPNWRGLVIARGEPGKALPAHPRDLLDHLMRDHGSDPAQREPAMAMIAGIMPRGKRGNSRQPNQSPERSRCPQGSISRVGKGHRSQQRRVGLAGLRQCLRRGVRGRLRRAVGPRGQLLCLVEHDRRRPPQQVLGRGRRLVVRKGLRARRVRRARVVPLRPMTWIRRGTLIRQRSHEVAPPPTGGRRCPGTSRAKCGRMACPWPRVCLTVRRWRRAL